MSFKRLKFWLITPFAVLLFIILLLLALVFFLSATKSGTSTLINLASRNLPALQMERADGSLLNNLELQRIVWEKDGVNIEVSAAELKLAAFYPVFTIEKLEAKRITLTLPEKEDEESKPFELILPDIHLPLGVDLRHVVVDELDIKQGDALIRLRDVRLNALVENDTLELRNLYGDLYDDDGNIVVAAKGKMGLSSPHPVELDSTVNGDSTRLGVGSLKLKASGEVADYHLTSSGHWKYADYPKYNLNFEGKGNLEYLDVDTFHLQGDAGNVDLNGRMSWSPELNWALEVTGDNLNPGAFAADYPGQLNMVWVTTGSLADKVSLQLELKELTGNLQDYPINAHMQLSIEDQAITLKNLDAKVGDNRLTAQGDADKTLAINWQLDAPKLGQLHESINGHLKGKGQLSGARDGSQFSIFIEQLNGQILDYPLQAEGGLRLDGELISADNLQLNVGLNQIQLNGSADEAQGIDWQIEAKKLSQLYPDLKGKVSGKGNIKGLLDGSRAELKIETLQGKVQDFPIKASGNIKREDQIVSAKELLLKVGQNQLTLNGSTGEDLGVDWALNAKNIKQLVPDINGNIKGSGQLSGALDGSAFRLKIAELTGKLEGRPLDIKGEVHSESGKISLQNLTVLAGKNRLNANGSASEPFDLTWDIDASKLSQVWPGLGGKLKGKGTLSGSLDQLRIQADLTGKKLRYEDLHIGSLDLKADQKGDIYTIKANIKKLQQGENIIQSASIKGKGKREDHTAALAIAHKDGKLELKAAGGWKNEQWQGTLKKLALRDTPAGNWRLRNPVTIKASTKAMNASKFCLANNKNAQICANAEWSEEQGVRAKGNLKKIPLKMAKPWLPDTLSLAGLANADFNFSQKNGKPVGNVDLRLPDSSFTITDEKGRKETLRYSNALANVSIKNKKAKLKASIDLKNRGQLRADGRIDLADNNKKSRLNAKVKLTIPDIHWVQQFSNDIDELKGKLEGSVKITGTIGKPRVTGTAKLQNASVFLPESGARLQAINLTMQAKRADQMAITGSLKAGQGLLNAEGNLYLANLPKWKADLKLSGERLLLMDTHEVQAFVSPNLSIKATPDSIAINGTVKIPETTITLRKLPVSAKARSDDIVIIGRGTKTGKGAAIRGSNKVSSKEDSPLDIKPNVVVELGNKVSFTGFGLDARLTGKLRVLRTRQDIVAQGALNVVDGTYEAYGQELEIERGRLIFDGPLDNPGLDVRVIREIAGDDITVGIALRGTAQNPESELFSTPPQTQTDTLSYLLTGQSVSSVGSGDTAMLTQAVAGLGIKGGEGLAQQLGSELGLDEVGINTKGGDYKSSELTLGKRIGSKLYIKYIVGLFDSLQKVAVTYQINKRLQLNAKTGLQQEFDLKYKFDTDKGLFGR